MLITYYLALAALVGFAVHRLVLALVLMPKRPSGAPAPRLSPPIGSMLVQLPLYNEENVAARLIESVCALRWPGGALVVQVLDDSTDGTREAVDRAAANARTVGVDVRVSRRTDRVGFKAGALAHGLAETDSDFVAIFDADFVPAPDFLEKLAPALADPRVGLAQGRWEHLNPDHSLLTRAQAQLLDGHFAVEQAARSTHGLMFNFNGTAGIWRRQAIIDAGGWQSDTITEDLDISYRAQLAGWRFVYDADVTAPAELPDEIRGFRSQQHRWAKGSIECMRKLLGRVARAQLRARVQLEALLHLTSNLAYLLQVVVATLLPVVVLMRTADGRAPLGWLDATLFVLGTGSITAFFALAAHRAGRPMVSALATLPLSMALDIGISLHKAVAVVEALRGQVSPFARTPKSGAGGASGGGATRPKAALVSYRTKGAWHGEPELLMAAWQVWALVVSVRLDADALAPLPFLLLFAVGYGYVGALGARTAIDEAFSRPATVLQASGPSV